MITIDVKYVYGTVSWPDRARCVKCGGDTHMTVTVSHGLNVEMRCNRCETLLLYPRTGTVRFVYGLADPRTELVSYVGCSANPIDRYQAHLNDRTHEVKYAWIRNLIDSGVYPSMIIFGVAGRAEANAMERHWISKLSSEGHPLVNIIRPVNMAFNITHDDSFLTKEL